MAQKAKCSVCNKEITENNYGVQCADGTYLCKTCFQSYVSALQKAFEDDAAEEETIPIMTPSQMKAELDRHVIGQEEAKRYFLLVFIIIIKGLSVVEQIFRKAIS